MLSALRQGVKKEVPAVKGFSSFFSLIRRRGRGLRVLHTLKEGPVEVDPLG
jgi:hypothetical protein